MRTTRKSSTTVGLDIGAAGIAATEVGSGSTPELVRTAIEPLESGAFSDGEVTDPAALSGAVRSLFSTHKLGKSVRVGVANQRVVVRTLRLPAIEDPEEIDTAVRFQAQDQIPMPLEQAVLDHQVVARTDSPEGEKQMDVVAVAARRDMVRALVDTLQSAGVRPIGVDVSAFGMIRALASNGAPVLDDGVVPGNGAVTLYCHLGEVTNLAVARDGTCLFTRISPFGVDAIVRRLAERRTIPLDRARELIAEAGVDVPGAPEGGLNPAGPQPAALPGSPEDDSTAAREVFGEGVSKLAQGVRMSLDGYAAQDGAVPIERVVACGPGTTIPGLVDRLGAEIGKGMEAKTPTVLAHLGSSDAARLTVSYGLALDG
ncbi:MAG: type IV pilus assembly protein PilM [Solirubrobacterales bacterium]|nr:type IV pilus assembly protein PilM [Solirubrobacterales bacterium]